MNIRISFIIFFIWIAFALVCYADDRDVEESGLLHFGDDRRILSREDHLVAIGADGMIWAIDKYTGEDLWSFDTGEGLFSFHCASDSTDQPFLLIPSSNGELFTYSEGKLHNIGTTIQELVAGPPLHTHDGSFWIASKEMFMWALDIDGNLVHSWSSHSSTSETLPNEWGNNVLVLTRVSYNLRAIDSLTGSLKWNISVSDFNMSSDMEEDVPEDLEPVIVASDGSVFVYNEKNDVLEWKRKLPIGIVITYALEKVISGNEGKGGLHEHWKLKMPPKTPVLPPKLSTNLISKDERYPGVFIGIHDGSLYAVPVSSHPVDFSLDNLPPPTPSYPMIGDGKDKPFTDTSLAHMDSPEEFGCDEQSVDFPFCLVGKCVVPRIPLVDENNRLMLSNANTQDMTTLEATKKRSKSENLILFNTACLLLLAIILYLYKRSKKNQSPNNSHPPLRIGKMFVENNILGHGSGGTIVYKGTLDGRAVAIKRMLREYFSLASQEIKILQQADEHPNVVRYYTHEKDQNFLYLALSYCVMNLDQFIVREKKQRKKTKKHSLPPIFTPDMLFDLIQGLCHIHSLNIIHRDLKPHNILIDPNGNLKISDMGLAKELDSDEHSFSSQSVCGTLGWQAPEQMMMEGRQSRKIDIFSLGCVLFYCLTEGDHPFGSKNQREINILNHDFSLKKLDDAVAAHLIGNMIQKIPARRFSAKQVAVHPFFWSAEKTLDFFRIASDRLESEGATDPVVVELEAKLSIFGKNKDWFSSIDVLLQIELETSKFRKYNKTKICDLLRVIRNKTHHYRDLPSDMQLLLGDLPHGFLRYWNIRFPNLLIETYQVLVTNCKGEANFEQFFC